LQPYSAHPRTTLTSLKVISYIVDDDIRDCVDDQI
jgi:hypothetical protein